jgi:hypothetical protein
MEYTSPKIKLVTPKGAAACACGLLTGSGTA